MTTATIGIVIVLFTAAPEKPAPTSDLARLQGRWTGQAGANRDIPVLLEVCDQKVIVDLKTPLGLTIHAEGELKLHDTASPKGIDWVKFSGGDGQDLPEILSIYEIDGDTWKFANGGPNNPRPSEFKPGDGPLADVMTLTRSKPAKSSVALDSAGR